MTGIMIQFRHRGSPPTRSDVARRLGIEATDIDADFGVIATDPDDGLYTIMIVPSARAKVLKALKAECGNDPAVGEFSNPRIEPFGGES